MTTPVAIANTDQHRPIRRWSQGDVVIFLHVPRTAGTSMRRLAKRQYEPGSILELYEMPSDQHAPYLEGLSEERRSQIRLLAGHFHFGLHVHLQRPASYFAVLRDPVERIASDFHYIANNPDHQLHSLVVRRCPTLEAFMRCPQLSWNRNGQVRGLGAFHSPSDHVPEEFLAIAKKNASDHFAVLGITERFDETLLLLEDSFGWRPSYAVQENVNRARPREEGISANLRTEIEERNALDCSLYRWAAARFQRELDTRGASFQGALRKGREKTRSLADLIHRAEHAVVHGEPASAITLLEQALDAEPRHALAHHWLSVALQDKSDIGGALRHAAIALELDPFERQIIVHAGSLLAKMGRLERARALYAFYLERHSPFDREIRRRLEDTNTAGGPPLQGLLAACARLVG